MKKTNTTTPRLSIGKRQTPEGCCRQTAARTSGALADTVAGLRFFLLPVLMVFFTFGISLAQPPNDCACNGQINVNLNGAGEAEVTVLEVIEVNDCIFNHWIQLRDPVTGELHSEGPQPGGPLGLSGVDVDCDDIGLWKAEILQNIGTTQDPELIMTCWGNVLIEDKAPPVIVCNDDVTLGCNVNNTPFDGIRVKDFIWEGEPDEDPLARPTYEFDGSFLDVTICASSLPDDAVVEDINIEAVVTHPNAGDVRIRMESPDLFFPGAILQSNGCDGPNMDIKLDDESNFDLMDACDEDGDPALSGDFQPNQTSLSDFDGRPASGNWVVRFNDVGAGATGIVERVVLQISYSSDKMSTPLVDDNCEEDLTVTYEDDPMTGFGLCPYGTIRRTWTVTDPSGNSSSCDQMVTVQLNDWDRPNVDFPGDLLLSCNIDPESLHPDSLAKYNDDVSGEFFDRPRERPADNDYCGNLGITYSDLNFDQCEPYGYKIRRLWTVVDWCDPSWDGYRYYQEIKVVDTIPPTISCPVDSMTMTVGDDCVANLVGVLPQPEGITDNCADENDIAITTHVINSEDGTIYKGSQLTAVPKGEYDVFFRAEDPCGNFAECQMHLTLEDLDPPTPVCDQNTTVALGWDGTARVCWQTFDDGSYDNCTESGDLIIQVRRMDEPTADFEDCVNFDCEDANGDIMVIMRVWDDCDLDGEGDNYNDCMINVEVQDKLNPTILCPDDVSISCTEDENDLVLTGQAVGSDNCEDMLTLTREDVSMLSACDVGDVVRTWTVTDPDDNSAQCTQVITKEDNLDEAPDVVWPSNITLNCPLDVDDLDPEDMTIYNPDDDDDVFYDDPRLDPEDSDYCGNIGFDYQDRVFDIDGCEQPAAFKIRRTWYASDWCYPQFDQTHIQEIVVIDTVPPTMTVDGPATVSITGNTCGAVVDVTVTATDGCSPGDNLTISNDENDQTGTGTTGLDFSETFPHGTHIITFTATDGCGNEVSQLYTVEVIDEKDPSPSCLDINVALKSTGLAYVYPQNLDQNSTDNCTDQQNLNLQVQRTDAMGNPIGSPADSVEVNCDDLGANNADSTVIILLIVEDEAGNSATCQSMVTIQSAGNCPDNQPTASIAGHIYTEMGDMVDNVNVNIDFNGINLMTGTDGGFNFSNMPVGLDYMLTAEKDVEPLNGVTTFDLVMIRKHILDLQQFDTPFKHIAADINRSGSITTFDLVALRKVILNLDPTFPNNASWRFVDANYEFVNPDNPLNEDFAEYVMNENLATDMMNSDFIGVKVGDVNGTVQTASAISAQDRFSSTLELVVQDMELEAGKTYSVPVTAKDFTEMLGYQFTLDFDRNALAFVSLEEGELPGLSIDNFGLAMVEDGAITTSWDEIQGVDLNDGSVLFEIVFTAMANTKLSEVLQVNSRYTKAEAYDLGYNLKDVAIRFDSDNGTSISSETFALYQNRPNPFSNETVISFNLPEAGQATLTVMDVSGKVLKLIEGSYDNGYNEVTVNSQDLTNGNVYYYQLKTKEYIATKKMVLIQ